MSIPDNQFSLTAYFKSKVTAKYPTGPTANAINNNMWVNMILYIYEYAPIISGLGAVCYALTSVVSSDILTIVINRNIIVFFNIVIGFCGATVIAEWIMLDTLVNWMIPIARVLSGIA
jgi:hypothetical protein